MSDHWACCVGKCLNPNELMRVFSHFCTTMASGCISFFSSASRLMQLLHQEVNIKSGGCFACGLQPMRSFKGRERPCASHRFKNFTGE